MAKLEPAHSTAIAQEIADVVYGSWYRQSGRPDAITGDRDKLFASKIWKKLCREIKIQFRMSTSYHPETDGSSEWSKRLSSTLRQSSAIRLGHASHARGNCHEQLDERKQRGQPKFMDVIAY